MINTFLNHLLPATLPLAALIFSGSMALSHTVRPITLSKFQHFAGGVVISAVSLELLPAMLKTGSISGMSLGYSLGVMVMLTVDRYAESGGTHLPIAIDLFIDGLLLAIGFAAGEQGGILLLIGLTLETVALGLVIGPPMTARGKNFRQVLLTLTALGMSIVAGMVFGTLIPAQKGFWFATVLGFGVAALLFLVIEELIAEAHETKDNVWTSALFFVGFFVPLLLGQLELTF